MSFDAIDLIISIASLGVSFGAIIFAYRSSKAAQRSAETAERSAILAEEANKLAEEANRTAKASAESAREANELSKSSLSFAKNSNVIMALSELFAKSYLISSDYNDAFPRDLLKLIEGDTPEKYLARGRVIQHYYHFYEILKAVDSKPDVERILMADIRGGFENSEMRAHWEHIKSKYPTGFQNFIKKSTSSD
ncbi:hypothetical protein [Roseibium album]|uniref:hypothetical protein n=1 Tax=Roseibium album TaxID=311410 RepID=UPI003296EF1A